MFSDLFPEDEEEFPQQSHDTAIGAGAQVGSCFIWCANNRLIVACYIFTDTKTARAKGWMWIRGFS